VIGGAAELRPAPRGALSVKVDMNVFVSGAAGFIGMHVCRGLLDRGDCVLGLDNLNAYYDVGLKRARLAQLAGAPGFRFLEIDVADRSALIAAFATGRPDMMVHLAAQAGVRHSIENPRAYLDANVTGFLNVLECCRDSGVRHLVYASSSSVYGGNAKLPFAETDGVDHPVSMYAATKKMNELMAHTFSHLHGLPTTGLRFFTVYGPWGRPDMAPMLFARAILAGQPIRVFNRGQMSRDFTYIDDVANGVLLALDRPPAPDDAFDRVQGNPSQSWAPYRVFNIGNHSPVGLLDFIDALERALGVQAQKELLPMQAGDVAHTYAAVDALGAWSGWRPTTDLPTGVGRFVSWYRNYERP
jgi:UDP-glucuronate 4-epimerase